MCPACWELRASKVQPQQQKDSNVTLVNAGLALGVVSLIPGCLAIQLGALVVNSIALVRARQPPARELRWRAALGLCLTGVGFVGSIFVLGLGS